MQDIRDYDSEFYTEEIDKVGDIYEGTVSLHFKGGTCFSIPLDKCDILPRVGDKIDLFGKGFGYIVRGAMIGENVYFYRSPEEEEQKRQNDILQHTLDRNEKFDKGISDMRIRAAKLPENFQDRLNRFEQYCGREWMVDFYGYELFVAEQAVLIAEHCKASGISVEEFRALSFEEQRERLPELSKEHSGNTFGASCLFASIHMEKPQFVPYGHAAIHGLVGCEAAGCWASRHTRTGETFPE